MQEAQHADYHSQARPLTETVRCEQLIRGAHWGREVIPALSYPLDYPRKCPLFALMVNFPVDKDVKA